MKKQSSIKYFGKMLAKLRISKGFSQAKLGDAIGASQRVIAYYEKETKYPPAHLLTPLAKALGVSTDELLGIQKLNIDEPENAALWRRLKKAEQLSVRDKRKLFDYLDMLILKSNSRQEKKSNIQNKL